MEGVGESKNKEEENPASRPFYYDVVNVSEGFQLRTAYKKKVKSSKLDGLLERRVKQFTLEEKQRLERLKQAALQSKLAGSKLAAAAVKSEGSTAAKLEPVVTPCAKAEERQVEPVVKDQVVKKLDFDEEQKEKNQTSGETDNLDVRLVSTESTGTNHSTRTEASAVRGSGGEALPHKEVNGGSQTNVDLSSKTVLASDTVVSADKPPKPEVTRTAENGKKRRYEVTEEGSEQKQQLESMEVDQSKTRPVQVNGKDGPISAPVDSKVGSDMANQAQGEIKAGLQMEPVKSLMNGSLSQDAMSNSDHPPPMKVPRLENHVGEKGDSPGITDVTNKNLEVSVETGETASSKLPSSTPSSLSNNTTDNSNSSSSSESLKSVTQVTTTTTTTTTVSTESRMVQIAKVSSSSNKPAVVSTAESSAVATLTTTTKTTTTQVTSPATQATISQETKTVVTATVADTKTGPSGSSVTTSMTVSKEYSTSDQVKLLRFSKSKKARSGTALPSYRKFVTKSSKKSIFVLPNDDLKKLARRGGIREVPIFNYNAKPALDIWPYPSPRPTFGITWRLVIK